MKDCDLITCIRERREIEPAKISLQKLLEQANMKNYLKICSNRIADARLIDGKEVEIDFANFPNLSLGQNGIINCIDILSGYIDKDKIKQISGELKRENEARELMNRQIRLLRLMKRGDLINFIKIPEKLIKEKEIKNLPYIQILCREELKSRSLCNMIKIIFKNYTTRLYISIRCARLVSLIKT